MTYDELVHKLTKEHNPIYYETMLHNSELILLEIGKKGKTEVAKELNVPPTLFSTFYKFILAHNNIVS